MITLLHCRTRLIITNRGESSDVRTLYLEDDEATRWLQDPEWQARWKTLLEVCPWSTAFQSVEFVLTWFEVYFKLYRPIVIYEPVSDASLTGLLVLAFHRSSATLHIAGAHQAEYQSWLSVPGNSADFMASSIALLSQRFPRQSLRFKYLPCGKELKTISELHPQLSRHLFEQKHVRPLLSIGMNTEIHGSLKKKSNKSKLNRLKRRGKLALRIVRSRFELEKYIDYIAALYDLRQSAANRTAPFFEDKYKREFHLRLMEAGLLHSAVLTLDDEVIAAILSMRNGKTLAVGVFTISPRFAMESPGKILLLLLAQQLATEDIQQIDLTPGGSWKDRFANRCDTVSELIIFFDYRQAKTYRHTLRAHIFAKRFLASVGITPAQIRPWISALDPNAIKTSLRKFWRSQDYMVFVLDRALFMDTPKQNRTLYNGIDAVTYPRDDEHREFFAIMSENFQRFSNGWQCRSSHKEGHIHTLIWSCNGSGREPLIEIGSVNVPVTDGSCLIDLTMHRRYLSLSAPDKNEIIETLRADCVRHDGQRTYAFIEGTDEAKAEELTFVGFVPFMQISLRYRLGKKWQINAQTVNPISTF